MEGHAGIENNKPTATAEPIRCADPLRCALRLLAALRPLAPAPAAPSMHHAGRGMRQ